MRWRKAPWQILAEVADSTLNKFPKMCLDQFLFGQCGRRNSNKYEINLTMIYILNLKRLKPRYKNGVMYKPDNKTGSY